MKKLIIVILLGVISFAGAGVPKQTPPVQICVIENRQKAVEAANGGILPAHLVAPYKKSLDYLKSKNQTVKINCYSSVAQPIGGCPNCFDVCLPDFCK